MAEGTGKISDGYYAIAEELRRRKRTAFLVRPEIDAQIREAQEMGDIAKAIEDSPAFNNNWDDILSRRVPNQGKETVKKKT